MLVRKALEAFLPIILLPSLVMAITREPDLLVWYKLDETGGAVAVDSSVKGNDGTLVGMDDADWVDGKFGKALDFGGGDDRVQIPLSVVDSYEGMSVSVWVKTAQAHTDAAHFYYGSPVTGGDGFGGNLEYHLNFVANNDRIQFYIQSTGGVSLASPNAFNDDQWHLVTAVNQPGAYTLYIDGGKAYKGVDPDSPAPYGFTEYHQLGGPAANRRQFVGLLDDFRIYSVTLAEAEVQALYGNGLGDFDALPTVVLNGDALVRVALGGTYTEEGAVAADPVDGVLAVSTEYISPALPEVVRSDALVAWWRMDDDATDASLNGNDGTLAGNAAFVTGKFGKALDLDGAGDSMDIASFNGIQNSATLSLSAWINLVDLGTDDNGDGAVFGGVNSTLFWVNYNGAGADLPSMTFMSGATRVNGTANVLNIGEWQHVVGVMDDGKRTLYIDGVEIATANGASTTTNLDGTLLQVGRWTGGGQYDFEGMIDDARVYNVALSALEILDIYSNGDGEVLPAAPTAVDTSVTGDWQVIYSTADQLGQTASAIRTVRVYDPQSPVITLVDGPALTHEAGDNYTPPQVTVQDAGGGDLDASLILTTGTVDPNVPGSYVLKYNFTDDQQRPAETVFQTVNVVDTTAPELTVTGAATIKHQLGQPYRDPGASAADFVDGDTHPFSSLYTPNQLIRRGYIGGPSEPLLILDANGGLMAQTPDGEAVFTKAIGFAGDSAFQDPAVGIDNRNDNFRNLFLGYFLAKKDGVYQIGMEYPDDRGVLWLDLDQDGVFESQGYRGNEMITDGYYGGYFNVTLQKGYYRIAIAHLEGTGPSTLIARFKAPDKAGPTSRQTIDPFEPAQDGLWSTSNPIDVNTPGTYTITYTAKDSSGNSTTKSRTVEVADYPGRPALALVGLPILSHPASTDFADPGVSVTDGNGDPVPNPAYTTFGGLDKDAPGSYLIEYNYTDPVSGLSADPITRTVVVIDKFAPEITLTGDAEIQHIYGEPYVDPGVVATDNLDGTVPVGSTADVPRDLWLHIDASQIDATNGEVLTIWEDLSGNSRHFTDVRGDPTYAPTILNGKPAVHLDGDDFMAITARMNNRYSIFTISQLTGTLNNRLISTKRNVNWFLGYNGGWADVFHPRAWATIANPRRPDTNPNLYTATSTGSIVQFWANTVNKTIEDGRNGTIEELQLGGYQTTSNPSEGDVAEIMLYNRVVTEAERLGTEAYLSSKYHLFGFPEHPLPDFLQLGEHTLLYAAKDSAGNFAFATRKVAVVPNPDAPVIQLSTGTDIVHEAGTTYTNPVVTILDKDGAELQQDDLAITGVVDPSKVGVYVITYTFAPAAGLAAIPVVMTVTVRDTTPPDVTLSGDSTVVLNLGDTYTEAGSSAVDTLSGSLTPVVRHARPGTVYFPGLVVGKLPGEDSMEPNPANEPVDPLGPSHSETTAKPPWADSITYVYTGQIYDADGVISFTENIDDNAILFVNGEEVLNDATWDARTSKAIDLGAGGWYDFEVRLGNATGGAGLANADPPGFGYDPAGGTNYVVPQNSDASTMDLFRYPVPDYTFFDTSKAGTYDIVYSATDAEGNVGTAIRQVVVLPEAAAPYIVLNGKQEIVIEAGTIPAWEDPGAIAKASDGTVLDAALAGTGSVDTKVPGTYSINFRFQDSSGNWAQDVVRTIVVQDTIPPEITLNGGTFVSILVNTPYADQGAVATDSNDGDIEVFSDLVAIPGRLKVDIHQRGWGGWFFNFDDPSRNLLTEKPNWSRFFVDGFLDAGIDLPDDAFVRATVPELTRSDYFSIVWSGQFHAPRDGEYTFSTGNVNNRGTIWLDKDQNGTFERTDGSLGDERLTWGNQTVTLFLAKGAYNFITGFSEDNASCSVSALVQTPEGAGPDVLTPIRPGDPLQADLWFTMPSKGVDTSTPGRYVVNYFAEDAAGHLVTTQRVVQVEEDPKQPLIRLLGEADITHEAGLPYQDAGILLEDYLGTSLDPALATVENLPDGSQTGVFTITYNFTDADGHVANQVARTVRVNDTIPPVVTLVGANPVTIATGQAFTDPGASVSDSFDAFPVVFSNVKFPTEGLLLHLDAATLGSQLNDTDPVTVTWEDLSGNGNHADNQDGDPTWMDGVLNGHPVVEFDGDDLIWTTKDFEADLLEYTVITVARYIPGSHGRVISSHDRNWLFGFHNSGTGRFYADGWIRNSGPNDNNWHLHAGTMDTSAIANFWRDNVQLAEDQYGANPITYMPRTIQLGGYGTNSERSDCQVAELLLYNRILSPHELLVLSGHLNGKYNLNGGGTPIVSVDTSAPGEFDVTYTGLDSSGNHASVVRKVMVVDQPQIPVITLAGDATVQHPAGEDYTDPGATVADASGNAINSPVFTIGSNVDITKPGTYAFTYDFSDAQGNAASTAVRTVVVVDQAAPIITLVGGESIEHQLGNPFVDPGFSAIDFVDGEVAVMNSVLVENLVRASAFELNGFPDSDLSLNANGGLLQRIPLETVDLTRGPHNSGLYISGDSYFRKTFPAMTRNDNFQCLFTGHFHTPSGGTYEFGINSVDDRSSFWLDLDQDELFEDDGDFGSEEMNIGNIAGFRTVELKPGYYRYGITFREGTGGSRIDAMYRAFQGYGPTFRTRIRTYDPFQDGSWVQYNPIPHNTPGEYQVTYTATDAAGNTATVVRSVVVRNNPDAGLIVLEGNPEMAVGVDGTFTDPGFKVHDLDGADITANGIGTSEGEVDTSRVGEYTITYSFFSDAGVPSRMVQRLVRVVDTVPPVITMAGDAEITILQGQEYVDPGASALDAYYGNLPIGSSNDFPLDGLAMHLDASSLAGKADWDTVSLWYDISGAGNHANIAVGSPTYMASSIGGKPAVHFDGVSSLRTGAWFDNQYSIITVSRLDGGSNQRLLSSNDQNWLLGYENNMEDAFYPVNGWVTQGHPDATTDPHLYSATSTGNNEVFFYAEGINKTVVARRNGNIGFFQMGAYRDLEYPASGEVSEVVLYSRALSSSELLSVEARLNAKYGLNGVSSGAVPVNTNKLGDYSVVYQAVDGSGNIATAIRTVHVLPDPDAPKITLAGDPVVAVEKGVAYVEPGFTLADKDGNDMGSGLVTVIGSPDHTLPGRYVLTYTYVPDRGSPAAEVTRVVNVTDTLAPVVTLNGDAVVKLTVGDSWTDPGAAALDQGDGATFVVSDLAYVSGQILKTGYKIDTTSSVYLNLDNNGGLLAETPVGTGYLTTGPGNDAFLYDSSQDFWLGINDGTGADVPDQADRFQILFTAEFLAPVPGEYEFGIVRQDDQASIWLDLDRDGIFETAGDNGDEQLRSASQGGWASATLAPGPYHFAVAFKEGTGGQYLDVGISLPETGNIPYNRIRIAPVDNRQRLLWGTTKAPLDTSVPGTHAVTYSSMDASGNIGTATRTVVIVADATLPLITLNGGLGITHEAGTAFTDPGATVTASDGTVLEADLKSTDAIDINAFGQQTIAYNYTDGQGKVAVTVTRTVTVVDTTAPAITLKAHASGTETVNLTVGEAWVDPGIDITDVDQAAWFVSSRDYIPNQLHMYGFLHDDLADPVLDFDNNGGLLLEEPAGEHYFKDGPLGAGYNFATDADWRRMPIGITRNDDFASYTTGYFYAKVDGDYDFRVDGVADRMGSWLDLDQDGVFESNGDWGNERLTWGNSNKAVPLLGGQYYKVIIGHFEWTGGSSGRFRFTTPAATSPDGETFLKPSDPAQNGLWLTKGDGPIDTNFPGTHTITYYAMDNAGQLATAIRTVVITVDPNSPVLTLVGNPEVAVELGSPFSDDGVSAATQAGDPITNPTVTKTVTRNGADVTDVDGNLAGTYVITYHFADDQSRQAVPVVRTVVVADTTPPDITLNGKATVTVTPGSVYNDPGATALDAIDGNVAVVITSSNPDGRYVPGLLAGNMGGNYSNLPNPGNDGVDPLGPSNGNTSAKPPWRDNRTFVYSGEIYDADGIISFREDIDDKILLHIGTVANVLNNTQATVSSENAIDLGEGGWFAFDLRMSNGSGTAGERTAPGFGYDPEGGTNYIPALNSDAQTMDLFRYLDHPQDSVDTSVEGVYTITFTATDAAGNVSTETRTVNVLDDLTLPLITLAGEPEVTLEAGSPFVDPGYTVADRRGTTFDATAVTHDSAAVDTSALGIYTVTYNFTSPDDVDAPAVYRKVTVIDTTPPVIMLIGGEKLRIPVGDPYTDPGFTVTDNLDASPTVEVQFVANGIQPVAHWEFDETDGTTAKELMNTLDGTLTNFPGPVADSWVAGKYGNALSFNSANSSFMSVPGSALLDLPAFTISVWIKTDDYSRNMFIFEKTTDNTLNSQYNAFFEDTGNFLFRVNDGAGGFVTKDIPSSGTFTTDVWQHLAVIYTGTHQKIYVEGELQADVQQDVTVPTTPSAGAAYIGAFAPGGGYYFHGLLDDLKIYGQEIPAAMIPEIGKKTGVDTSSENKVPPYTFSYTSTDSQGNTSTLNRQIVVSNDSTPPVLTLVGDVAMQVDTDAAFQDPGATADDNIDGDITPLVIVSGTVDTSKPGTYTLTYSVEDLSFNKATELTRTVTVADPVATPFDQWVLDNLSSLPVDKQDPMADPDHDRVPNLLEYAIGGDPAKPDRKATLPEASSNSGSLQVTFLRVKPSFDPSLTYKVELTRKLKSGVWSEADVTVTVDADQTGVPANYEKVTATSNTPIASETEKRQFIRVTVER